jgi:hypothetical protein
MLIFVVDLLPSHVWDESSCAVLLRDCDGAVVHEKLYPDANRLAEFFL